MAHAPPLNPFQRVWHTRRRIHSAAHPAAHSAIAARLRPIRALISDLDGTLVAGNRPQPGLLPFLELLARRGVALTVVTNNTVRTPEQYRGKLAALGATLAANQIITAAQATAEYLRGELPPAAAIFVIGESGLRTALIAAGFR